MPKRALLHAVMVMQFLPGIDNIDKATVFTYVAHYNAATGDLGAAERYAQSAIRLAKEEPTGRRTHANALLALADVRVRQEQPEQALELLTEARQVIEDTFGPDHYLVVDALRAGIPVLQSLGRKDEAQQFEQLIAERNKRVQRLVQVATPDDE